MLTVGKDAGRVERMLEEGSLACPGCGGAAGGVGACGVPLTFRTADPYRIFTGKDGINCQGKQRIIHLSSVKRQPVW